MVWSMAYTDGNVSADRRNVSLEASPETLPGKSSGGCQR